MERKADEEGGNGIIDTGGGVCSRQVEGHFFFHNERGGE